MKTKYILACTTQEDAKKLFRAFEMLGFKWDANVFNIDNNYCWDIHRLETQYKLADNNISFGTMTAYTIYWSELGYRFCTVDVFIHKNVKWYHILKYWLKNKLKNYNFATF